MFKKILKYFFNFFFMSIYYHILKNKVSQKLNPISEIILGSNKRVKKVLSEQQLSENFDLSYHTKNIDFIFKRVFS